MARVNDQQGAKLLGMTLPTFKRFRRAYAPGRALPTFPPPDANGLWLPSALKRWNAARPGRGMPGIPKPKSPSPCEVCREPTLRRTRDEIDGLLKCKPCYTTASPLP